MFPFLLKLCADRGYQGPEFRRALKKGLARANFETVNRLAHLEAAVAARKSAARRGRIADAGPGAISFGGASSLDRHLKTFKPDSNRLSRLSNSFAELIAFTRRPRPNQSTSLR